MKMLNGLAIAPTLDGIWHRDETWRRLELELVELDAEGKVLQMKMRHANYCADLPGHLKLLRQWVEFIERRHQAHAAVENYAIALLEGVLVDIRKATCEPVESP